MTKAVRVCKKCNRKYSVLAFATRTGSICRWCKEAGVKKQEAKP